MKTSRYTHNMLPVSIILAFSAILAFSNTLCNDFVYDDSAYVVNNHHIRDFSHFLSYFTSLHTYQSTGAEGQFKVYRPLVTASFALDYAIWKLNPFGYHLTNLILHYITSILIYIFFCTLLKHRIQAFITAIIFLIHPVQVEAVAWISGRGNMLYAILSILSLTAFLRYLTLPDKKSIIHALIWYTMALFAKETAVAVLPLMILIFLFSSDHTHLKLKFKKLLILLVPFFIVTAIYTIIRTAVIDAVSQRELWGGSYSATVATMVKVALLYLYKLVLPVKLNVLQNISVIPSLLSINATLFSTALLVIAYFCGIRKNTSSTVKFGFWWILLALLPVSNIIPLQALFAERFLYLSVAGFGCIVAYIFFYVAVRKKAILATCLIIVSLNIKTISRNSEWQSNDTLWKSVLAVDPQNAKAYNGIGMAYLEKNDLDNAATALQKAIRYAPDNLYITNNLALVFLKQGNKDEALRLFEKTLKMEGNQAVSYHNLGLLYLEQKRYSEALFYLEKTVELDKRYANAYNSLGMCYFYMGEHEKAISAWLTSASVRPDDPQSYYNIIISYLQKNDFDNANLFLRKAIKIFPEHPSFEEIKRKLR
ncbi:MAG: tetratricopeptide repeat protein [Candidatus Auribacterota bacterium]|nr:tetratricopeptide repeat protein [Candidatus Auribacterota bacterium]